MIGRKGSLFLRILGLLFLAVVLLEFRGALTGSLAFVSRPTLVLTPIHAPSLDDEQIAEVRLLLERELAAAGNHALYPKSLIENFYLERDNATDAFNGSYRGRDEAFELGRALGVERIAQVSVYGGSASMNLYLKIYDVRTEQSVKSLSLKFSDYSSLMNWQDIDGIQVNLEDSIGATVPGMSAGAMLYLIWIGLNLIPAGLLISGRMPWRGLVETLLTAGLLLSLFSWIYALNGDMDYVQRFVATSGSLDIDDTSVERAATLWRYLAPMALLLLLWVIDVDRRIRARKELGGIPAREIPEIISPALAGCSAVLFTLSLPNFLLLEGLPILGWIALTPLYLALRRTDWRRGVGMMLLFTGLQALLVNWWQGTFSYVSLPFTVGLTLIQYLPFALLLTATVRFFPRTGFWAAALLWTAFDWIRSLGFLGYPWGILGVSQYGSTALIQSASVGGVWLVSLLTHLGSATAAMGLEGFLSGEADFSLLRSRKWAGSLSSRSNSAGGFSPGAAYWIRPWIPALSLVAVVLLISGAGAWSIARRDRKSAEDFRAGTGRRVRILAVQQNTDPRKHDYRLSFEELSRLTDDAVDRNRRLGEPPFNLVAWPESGFVPDVRFWLDESRSRRSRAILVREMLDWQQAAGVNLVTGNQDHFYEEVEPDPEDPEAETDVKRIQNSALFLRADRTDDFDRRYYYKIRLVPFTENFPFEDEFPRVAELLHNFSTTQWTPGSEHIVFNTGEFRFSTPICFEDVFPDHVRRFVLAGAEVLVNMSNDYWANTALEGYQHAAHAVFRAVENRRPMVRATCSGWTISVDPEGRIGEQWPAFYTAGWTIGDFVIPDEPGTSFYTRYGDWVPLLSAMLWIVLTAGELIFRRKGDYP